VFQF